MSKKTNIKVKISENEMSNIKTLKNFVPSELVKTDIAVAVAGSIDAGKCFGKGTKIMMHTGNFKNVEEIKQGDILMGDDSTPRKVLETHKGRGQLYKIIPENGNSYIVNGNHILSLKWSRKNYIQYDKKNNRFIIHYYKINNNCPIEKTIVFNIKNRTKEQVFEEAQIFLKYKKSKLNNGDIVEISVEEFIKLNQIQQNNLKWYKVGVEFPEKQLPLDPYILGYWLGRQYKKQNNFVHLLKQLNLIKNKHIPDLYKYNSRKNRQSLLAGITYSCGQYNISKNTYQLTIPKKYGKLIDDVLYLIKSLGFPEYYKKSVSPNKYELEFSDQIPNKNNISTKIKIIKYNIGDYYGFETDGNHRFLLGDFSVAHNSSLIGVLFSGELDDGNGLARNLVARHKHEIESGRTSDISTRMLYCGNNKAVTLIDLCGHEKYLKTTTCGITGQFPDYAVVIVAANRGILKMTKEHLGILFYMQIPVIIAITRADIAPTEIYNNTVRGIRAMCKMYNKTPEFINSLSELTFDKEKLLNKETECISKARDLAKVLQNTCDHIPIITLSNKTGYYVNVLRQLLYNLEPRKLWDASNLDGSVFYIDSVFNPPGIGLVLAGICKGKTIFTGDTVYLGPFGKEFIPIRIRSMHNNSRQIITELYDHERGCIAISAIGGKQELSRNNIHRGMIIISNNKLINNVCYRFRAEVEVLHHSTTISTGYSPVIHLGPIRQSARIVNVEQLILKNDLSEIQLPSDDEKLTIRTGDKAIVTFKLKCKSEFVENGTIFFFREGTTRGVGKVIEVIPITEDNDAIPDSVKFRKAKGIKKYSKKNKSK